MGDYEVCEICKVRKAMNLVERLYGKKEPFWICDVCYEQTIDNRSGNTVCNHPESRKSYGLTFCKICGMSIGSYNDLPTI